MCSTASLILFYILHFSSIVATNAEDEDFWKLHEISSTEALIFYFGGSSQWRTPAERWRAQAMEVCLLLEASMLAQIQDQKNIAWMEGLAG
ncbi:uncharacterized protein LOC131054791 isoform X2 [Cryptomeria japonica]|uniref:uncharacterized protein LOC131054791 isoform X2 n=1 Tax=Cryptomeria japonica TaxID=3369 RepID=UPI0025AD179E|nr:uncharacterized protein LOC131054791 isoform X2 [Cryptomeria japonica]